MRVAKLKPTRTNLRVGSCTKSRSSYCIRFESRATSFMPEGWSNTAGDTMPTKSLSSFPWRVNISKSTWVEAHNDWKKYITNLYHETQKLKTTTTEHLEIMTIIFPKIWKASGTKLNITEMSITKKSDDIEKQKSIEQQLGNPRPNCRIENLRN